MRRTMVWWSFLLLGWASAQEPPGAGALTVSFSVDATRPESGRVQVTMSIDHNRQEELSVAIPAWAPGAYRIVKYCRQVASVEAFDPGGARLVVTPADEQTWTVKTQRNQRLDIRYELTLEKSRFDPDHCFLAGPDTYFYVVDHKSAPCRAVFSLPDGWKVATGLGSDGTGYSARDYDTFIDCPTELGRFERHSFQSGGATYEVVVHAKGPIDGERLTEMCRRVVQEQNKIFGPPPFDRYVFFYHLKDGPGGRGLEHLNSTDITMPYNAIRVDPSLAASVTSHEYFHLWNVKRLRPAELGPFDYTQIVRSKALWMCEGVTSYYGDRALERAGLWKEQQYLDHLAGEIETLQNNPDRSVTSIETASESVWDRKDWPRVDYYNKGELLGVLMDLKIRSESRGESALDDVMRWMYRAFVVEPARQGRGPIGVGYPQDGILRALEEVTGRDWKRFYAQYVRGVEELPYQEVMGAAGLDVALTVVSTPDLGIDLRGTSVANVAAGSEAEKSGVRSGDRITGINDVEVNRANLREVMSRLTPGEDARIQIVRSGEKLELVLRPVLRQRTTCKIRRADRPSSLQSTLLNSWLGKLREY